MKVLLAGWLFAGLAIAQLENARVGHVDFYALEGLDVKGLREAVTVKRGDRFVWPATRDTLRDEVSKAAGRPVTHFSPVCCDESGLWILYVGFGQNKSQADWRPRRTGEVKLPPELTALYDEMMAMLPASLKFAAGRPDDYSKGYSLSLYEPMRSIQSRMREAALQHGELILQVLNEASADRDRIAASLLAGYVRHSPGQISALVDAARDPNDTVRNNATRSLGVLAATPEYARAIAPWPFIDKLNSNVWSDRNKGLMLLAPLTRDRRPDVLSAIRAKALPALIEMAQWRFAGHSANAIRLLGRIVGIHEADVEKMAAAGRAQPVLKALSDMAKN